MQFKIEQIAIAPHNPTAAMELLTAMGAGEWAKDHVVANGSVFEIPGGNEADLAFDYEMLKDANELEVLHYTAGDNWLLWNGRSISPSVSHFGMHCTEEELAGWKVFFASRDIGIAQEVYTDSHSNPAIAGKRNYHYCIFDTREILSVDIKFIVRIDTATSNIKED